MMTHAPDPLPLPLYCRRYLGLTSDDVAWCFIQASMMSVARTAVIAMQVRSSSQIACGAVQAPRSWQVPGTLGGRPVAPLPLHMHAAKLANHHSWLTCKGQLCQVHAPMLWQPPDPGSRSV